MDKKIVFLKIPAKCPVCGKETSIHKDNDSEVLYCENPSCEGKFINRVNYFCGKRGLDIKGLSVATLEKLIDWGWINSLIDIFKLNTYRDEWSKKSGFGVQSVDKILNSIETSKITTLDKFISSLGIPLIGPAVSKELVKHVDSYEDFRDKINNHYDFSVIDSFAISKTESLLNYDYTEADEIFKCLTIAKKKTNLENNSNTLLQGLNIAITGKLEQYKNRHSFQNDIESNGGKVVNSITSHTNILINNNKLSTSSKNITAKKLNIPILTEQEFIQKYLKY